MRHQVVLATVGSLGDLHPFIALARVLRGHGLNVVIACAAEYRNKVEAAGIEFHPLRPGFHDMQRDLGMDRAQLTRGVVVRAGFLFRKLLLPYVGAAYEDMMAITADADLVLASSLAFGARLAAEKRGIPWVAVVLQPMMFLSAYDPPVLANAECLSRLLRRLGPAPTRCALRVLKKAVNCLFRPLHRLRAEIGLPAAAQNPLFDGQFMAAGAIGLYSNVLGDVQPDYPQPSWVVGFATFDSEDGRERRIAPRLDAFLKDGAAPLVFTLGSLIVNCPGSFYAESVRAARMLGRRAVLLVGEQSVGALADLGTPEVFVCAYAPHSLLFARAAAIIHHGGIGTLAQALRAGKPQLIVPYFADQIDNAARAARLGTARTLPPRRYRAARAMRELARLQSGCYAARAALLGGSLAAEHGAERAARIVLDTLERLGRK